MWDKESGLFLDKTMSRQQLRACRSVMRKVARMKDPDPMLVMAAFDAARARGWMGPDTKKALPYRALHLKKNPKPRPKRSWFLIGWNRRHEPVALNRAKRRELHRILRDRGDV
jgi:hypothetical protein